MKLLTKTQEPQTLHKKSIWKDKASWQLLLLCIPAMVAYLFFSYIPMATAITIPFRDYKFSKGIFGSEFVGFRNFAWIFKNAGVIRALKNTFYYGLVFMVLEPLCNAGLALLLFEITSRKLLKTYQTIITFPNFMSMVVVGYVTYAILSPRGGFLNQIIQFFGGNPTDVYTKAAVWPLILTLVHIWKSVGMGSMMYYASLVGVDATLYEAAEIDGAGRWQKMRYISIPHLIPLVCIYTIMGAGKLVDGDFGLNYIIPRDSTVLYQTTDIIDTYVYRALAEAQYATGATVGLLKTVISILLVLGTNALIKKISPENAMF